MHCISVSKNMAFSLYKAIGTCGALRTELEIIFLLREGYSLK